MILYLHGFNSSPQSGKARALAAALAAMGRADQFQCPALHHRPAQAIAQAEALIVRAQAAAEPVTLVGSSLGGYYATCLSERHRMRAVLLNPAVAPALDLDQYRGWQTNLYTGERYELTAAHLHELLALRTDSVTPERYLLIVETGDEVLDYRLAVQRFAGCQQIIVPGGDHSLGSFAQHLPRIIQFAGIIPAG